MLQHADQRPENVTRECCTAKHPFLVQQVLNSLKKDFSTGSCVSDLATVILRQLLEYAEDFLTGFSHTCPFVVCQMNDLKSVLMAVERRFGFLLEFAHRCQEDGR